MRADSAPHKAAKEHFNARGVEKLPAVKPLNAGYAALMAEKAAYSEYRKAREDMKELLTAKANIATVFWSGTRRRRKRRNGGKRGGAELRCLPISNSQNHAANGAIRCSRTQFCVLRGLGQRPNKHETGACKCASLEKP